MLQGWNVFAFSCQLGVQVDLKRGSPILGPPSTYIVDDRSNVVRVQSVFQCSQLLPGRSSSKSIRPRGEHFSLAKKKPKGGITKLWRSCDPKRSSFLRPWGPWVPCPRPVFGSRTTLLGFRPLSSLSADAYCLGELIFRSERHRGEHWLSAADPPSFIATWLENQDISLYILINTISYILYHIYIHILWWLLLLWLLFFKKTST